MSSAQNHRIRSHKSEWRKGAYGNTARRSVGTPTLHKQHFADLIRLIRKNSQSRRENHAAHKAAEEAI